MFALIVSCVFVFELVARFRGERDFEVILQGGKPVRASKPQYPADGGSVVFEGFGYSVWHVHEIQPALQQADYRYCVGSRLEYWLSLPIIARNRDATIIVTNR